jgi:hypothetical protein
MGAGRGAFIDEGEEFAAIYARLRRQALGRQMGRQMDGTILLKWL